MRHFGVVSLLFLFACEVVPSPEEACDESARAYCTKLDQCRVEGVAESYGDQATCVARRSESCVASLSSPDTGNTPLSVEDCARAEPAESCQDFLQNNPVAACLTPSGDRNDGDPCMFNSECDSAFCAIASTDSCGVCEPAPAIGDECVDQGCGYDLTCTTNKACAAWVPVDGACDVDHPCSPHNWCVTAEGAATGTCMPSVTTQGAACDPHKYTAPGCDFNAGLYCNTMTSTCTSLVYVAAGEACGNIDGDYHECVGGATCRGTPAMCIADADDGAPCDTVLGPSCMSPARCVTDGVSSAGTCTLPDPGTCSP
jgi:hypothetical protein